MLPFSAWWLVAIAVLILGIGIIIVLKDENLAGLIAKAKNIFTFRGAA